MHKSLAATFFARSNSLAEHPAVRYKEGRSEYKDMNWAEFGTLTGELAFGLAALGLQPQHSVAIFANNSHLWVAADYATISNGGVSVPIYPTSSQSDIEFILDNSDTAFAFVQNEKLLKKILSAGEHLSKLQKIVLFTTPEDKSLEEIGTSLGLTQAMSQSLLIDVERLRQLGRTCKQQNPTLIDERVSRTDPTDAATIIYTSGTTGVPKGVKLTHSNILSILDDLPEVFPLKDGDVYLSYLPMSHVFERVCGEFYWTQSGGVIAFAESIEMMAKNLAEVQPTMILVVPRVLDRIHAKVKSGMEGASGRAKKLIDWSLYVGKEVIRTKAAGQQPSPGLRAKLWLAEKLVFNKLRQRIGSRLRLVISGGAPATPHVIEFFNAVGIQTLEGYGLTETSAPASVNRTSLIKIGSVGPVLPSVNVRIAEDGEILLKGGSIFSGYHKNDQATQDAFDNGWFKTGDIGCIDKDGHLRITDRKKDLIINAAGKNIAPQRIEAVLKTIPHVTQAVVFGDKQKHLVALLTLDEHAVGEFAREKNWQYESYQDLTQSPELKQFIRKEIHLRSGQLADYEQIRKFEILPQDLSVEEGELTATLKIRRNVIAKRYAATILRLYQEKETPVERENKSGKAPVKDSFAEHRR